MTDEELGRNWAERHGKRPNKTRDSIDWYKSRTFVPGLTVKDGPHNLPPELTHIAERTYPTESAAYAALGRALRQLVTFAGGVREVMKV